MIQALAWKEYREQRAAWLLMPGLALGLIVVAVQITGPSDPRTTGVWRADVAAGISIFFAGAYGIVCAALLLAGERESGTAGFLNTLSGRRTDLWRTKFLVGLALTAAQAVVLMLAVALLGFGMVQSRFTWNGTSNLLFPFVIQGALEAFAWGMLVSARCRSVLGAIGLTALVVGGVWLGALGLAALTPWSTLGALLLDGIGAIVALWGSWWWFSREDIERASSKIGLPAWMTLSWLVLRQGKGVLLALTGAGLILGLLLPYESVLVWSVGTLAVGLVCGLAAFAGEQTGERHRFFGDQRLPPWTVWSLKAGVWLAVGVGVALLMIVAAGLDSPQDRFLYDPKVFWQKLAAGRLTWKSGLLSYFLKGPMLLIWLSYGFSTALVATLLVRKTLVALVLALVGSVTLLALWLPSLIGGGLRWWQLLAVPALFLVTTRLLLRSWAGEGIHARRTATGLAACGLATAGWMAANIGYRGVQYPDVGPPFDVAIVRASIPTGERNRGGRLVQIGADNLVTWRKTVLEELGPLTPLPEEAPDFYEYEVEMGLWHLWPKENARLAAWLDRVFQGKWIEEIRQAAASPLGVVEDLRKSQPGLDASIEKKYQDLGLLLAGRGLQLQARGQSAAALESIALALAVSRQQTSWAHSWPRHVGSTTEEHAFMALAQWLLGPGRMPDVLRRVIEVLVRHEAELPSRRQTLAVDYVAAQRSVMHPDFPSWPPRDWRENLFRILYFSAEQVPWERERYRRGLNLVYRTQLDHFEAGNFQDLPRLRRFDEECRFLSLSRTTPVLGADDRPQLSLVRRVRLLAALVAYEAEHQGRPPSDIGELMPRYLTELPVDPYTGQPFGYRRSAGEYVGRPEGHGLLSVFSGGAGDSRYVLRLVPGRAVIEWTGWDHSRGVYAVPEWSAAK